MKKKTPAGTALKKYGLPLGTHILGVHLGTELDGDALTIASDGSYDANTGHAAFAWISDDGRYRTGEVQHGDSLLAELTALTEAVEFIASADIPRAVILIDCRAAIAAVAQVASGAQASRKHRPVRLASRIVAAAEGRDVEIRWVRGHDGHTLNSLADKLANVEMCARRHAVSADGFRQVKPLLQRFRDMVAGSLSTDPGYELAA
ncbi:ribonuclease HI [Agromyces humi]|uniref:ribonuclease HI n=1 Tax=Agromyces humi TaxID=1766800 RepID=UPI001358920F|nr:RNase H family protein [Agromyces humi]